MTHHRPNHNKVSYLDIWLTLHPKSWTISINAHSNHMCFFLSFSLCVSRIWKYLSICLSSVSSTVILSSQVSLKRSKQRSDSCSRFRMLLLKKSQRLKPGLLSILRVTKHGELPENCRFAETFSSFKIKIKTFVFTAGNYCLLNQISDLSVILYTETFTVLFSGYFFSKNIIIFSWFLFSQK